MSTKPTELVDWDSTDTNISVPSGGQQAAGFATGDQVPSGWLNWFFRNIHKWIQYLSDGAFTATSGNAVTGTTSDAAAYGVDAVTSANGSALRSYASSAYPSAYAENAGSGNAVSAVSNSGVTITATATSNDAIRGFCGDGSNLRGVYGGADINGNVAPSGVYGEIYGSGSANTGLNAGVRGVAKPTASTEVYGVHGKMTSGSITGVTAAGVKGDGSDCSTYGVIAEGDATTPIRAAFRIVPQDTAPSAALEGDIYMNSVDHKLYVYNGSAWVVVGTQT